MNSKKTIHRGCTTMSKCHPDRWEKKHQIKIAKTCCTSDLREFSTDSTLGFESVLRGILLVFVCSQAAGTAKLLK